MFTTASMFTNTHDTRYGEELFDDGINPAGNSTLGCPGCTVRCCPMRTTNVFRATWTLTASASTVFEHEYKEFRYAELFR
jgi:hypothetical protein